MNVAALLLAATLAGSGVVTVSVETTVYTPTAAYLILCAPFADMDDHMYVGSFYVRPDCADVYPLDPVNAPPHELSPSMQVAFPLPNGAGMYTNQHCAYSGHHLSGVSLTYEIRCR